MIATNNVTPRFSRRSPSFTIQSVARGPDTDAPLWDDPVERATRRASWTRRQAFRRVRRDRGQRFGLVGAVLTLLLMLVVSAGPDTNPLARADARHKAELQQRIEQAEPQALTQRAEGIGVPRTML